MNSRKVTPNLSLLARNSVCKHPKRLLNYTGLNQIRREPEKKITSAVLQWRPSHLILSQSHHQRTNNGGNLLSFTRPQWPVEFSPADSGVRKFDVFISFRGEDTRENFTSHLYDAMCRSGIKAFIDNEGLEKGEEMWPSFTDAIARSKIAVVVFSKNYATSRWCLSELVRVVECRRMRGQIVLPIFYHVEPKEVRWQTGNYGGPFAKHDEMVRQGLLTEKEVRMWRYALRYVANLSGFSSDEIRSESKLVQEVVDCVLQKLQCQSSREDGGDRPEDHVLLVPFVLNLSNYVEQEALAMAVKKGSQVIATANSTTTNNNRNSNIVIISEPKSSSAPVCAHYFQPQTRVLMTTSSHDVQVVTSFFTSSEVDEDQTSAVEILYRNPAVRICSK